MRLQEERYFKELGYVLFDHHIGHPLWRSLLKQSALAVSGCIADQKPTHGATSHFTVDLKNILKLGYIIYILRNSPKNDGCVLRHLEVSIAVHVLIHVVWWHVVRGPVF